MRTLLRKHSLIFMAVLAMFFIAGMIAFYTWGIDYLVTVEGQVAAQPKANTPAAQFNINGAQKLDFRGTLQSNPGQ